MAWLDTLIGAGLALVSGGAGAGVSWVQTTRNRKSNEDLQSAMLRAKEKESLDLRQYQQRREAYPQIMTYVEWCLRVNLARMNVAERRKDALQKVTPTNVMSNTDEDVKAMRAAFDNSGPTEWEQRMIDARPQSEEMFRILGLADAFASTDVLDGFLHIVDSTETLEKVDMQYEKVLMDFPGPLGLEPEAHKVSDAAKQQIEWAVNLLEAAQRRLRAVRQYSEVASSVLATIRAELGNTDLPAT
jgi:hypothetical protein